MSGHDPQGPGWGLERNDEDSAGLTPRHAQVVLTNGPDGEPRQQQVAVATAPTLEGGSGDGVEAQGTIVLNRALRRQQVLSFPRQAGALRHWHGSELDKPPLGAEAEQTWPHGATDAAGLREAICEARQD